MKKLFITFALMIVAITTNAQISYCFDSNGDGEEDIQDVMFLVNHLLG